MGRVEAQGRGGGDQKLACCQRCWSKSRSLNPPELGITPERGHSLQFFDPSPNQPPIQADLACCGASPPFRGLPPTFALQGIRLRDEGGVQARHVGRRVVRLLLLHPGVDHEHDVVDGDGRLRDVGGDDDLAGEGHAQGTRSEAK